MTKYLLMYCWGPMQSWGGIAVGKMRPTDAVPTKSALVGLLSASLGIKRSKSTDGVIQALGNGLEIAVRIDSRGVKGADYHTAQVPQLQRGYRARTRYDELITSKKWGQESSTILSTREYLQDAAFLIALRGRRQEGVAVQIAERGELFNEDGSVSVDTVEKALSTPRFHLSLGRKSCAVGIPILPIVTEAPSFVDAMNQYPMEKLRTFLDVSGKIKTPIVPSIGETRQIVWEGDDLRLQPSKEIVRRDSIVSRARWQFDERRENFGSVLIES